MKMSQEQLKTTIQDTLDKLTPEQQQVILENLATGKEKQKLNEERYTEVYHRLDRLLKLTKCDAPSIILANELRTLCELYSSIHPKIEVQVGYAGLQSEGEV